MVHPDIGLLPDESLVGRLPLPLAQLYRRAHNALAPLEQHLAAFYLWEASLKLLTSAAVVARWGLNWRKSCRTWPAHRQATGGNSPAC
jgi:hypothetical protein